jgi:hypothetical protein
MSNLPCISVVEVQYCTYISQIALHFFLSLILSEYCIIKLLSDVPTFDFIAL